MARGHAAVKTDRENDGMTFSRSWLLATVALVPAALVQPAQAAVHRFHEDHVLGASMELVVAGADAEASARALAAAKADIARLDRTLSGWRPDSELARLNASTGPMAVSHDLYRVIERCEAFRAASGGAFSARIGEAEALWRAAERMNRPADAEVLEKVARRAEAAAVRLDPAKRTIDRDGVVFSVDALAKGYVIDQALEAAARAAPKATGLMLDIGGDLRCRGAGPDAGAWRVGLMKGGEADNIAPARLIRLKDQAVATSGPGARDRLVEGKALNHTLTPADGKPATARTVTVVADRAADADAIATAVAAKPAHEGLAFATSQGARARIVEPDGRVLTTDGWSDLVAPASIAERQAKNAIARLIHTAAPAKAAPWPAGFQVDIDYEIAYVAAGRYHSPFVAIWVSDEDGKTVRTLFHLGNRPLRFLDSNYVWWKGFDADGQGQQKLAGVTRPTRAPGKYDATWDGKDDTGNPLPQGRYVINIEMSREHGGHSLQSIPLDIGRAPVTGAAQGQGESGPAAARYGRPTV
jgi:thiamine biosynthesis lipoprotein